MQPESKAILRRTMDGFEDEKMTVLALPASTAHPLEHVIGRNKPILMLSLASGRMAGSSDRGSDLSNSDQGTALSNIIMK